MVITAESAAGSSPRRRIPAAVLIVPLLLLTLPVGLLGVVCVSRDPVPVGRYTIIGPGCTDAALLQPTAWLVRKPPVIWVTRIGRGFMTARAGSPGARPLRLIVERRHWSLGPFTLVLNAW